MIAPWYTKANEVVGMTLEEATKLIEGDGFISRVVEKDGEFYPITAELRQDRINLSLKDNKVVNATVG